MAHHSDVGGIVAGSNALGATEIYQEGLRIPFLKYVEAGRPVQAIADLVRERQPDCITFDDWKRIDALESERGSEQGRPRVKFITAEEMLAAIGR